MKFGLTKRSSSAPLIIGQGTSVPWSDTNRDAALWSFFILKVDGMDTLGTTDHRL